MTDKTVPLKPKKMKELLREQLVNMDKDELIDKIMQLEAHNSQLKNIISKNVQESSDKECLGNKKKFDFSKCHYRRVLLRISYFGWDYQGLAVQEDSSQTIEHYLFYALRKSCLIEKRETSQYHRCGRTDKGVSAFGQVISITLRSKFPPESQNSNISSELPYCKILNRLLPKEIRAVAWMPIPDDKPEFSARFDCKKRLYKYYFPRSSLNIEAMNDACAHLIGSHDFRHLCKMDVGNGVVEFTREIIAADIRAVDDRDSERPLFKVPKLGSGLPQYEGYQALVHRAGLLRVGGLSTSFENLLGFSNATSMFMLVIEGNAFLWHQIRCIMGVLLLVGGGRESPDIVKDLLDIETNPRTTMIKDCLNSLENA